MKQGTTSHPKFRSLMRRLKLPQYAVVGLLESIWLLAGQFADDGDITRFSAEEIADYSGWENDADELVDALVDCRWLDRVDESLLVHDWAEHRPKYVTDRLQKRAKRSKVSKTDNSSSASVGESRRYDSKVGENRGLPSQVKSNQVQPSQETASDDADDPKSRKNKKAKARTYSKDFESFWAVYWNRKNKADAGRAFGDAISRIVDDDEIPQATGEATALSWLIDVTARYAGCRRETEDGLHAATFLNNDRFKDELEQTSTPESVPKGPKSRRVAS